MTEATAYRLKQIMTQEHLSLTQTAKQIGISPSSMRKALKDIEMSRPITFKINRFIAEHPIQQSKNSFTIFDSAEAESAQQPNAAKPAQPTADAGATPTPAANDKPKRGRRAQAQTNEPVKAEQAPAAPKQSRRRRNAQADQSTHNAQADQGNAENNQPQRRSRQNQTGKTAESDKPTRRRQSRGQTEAKQSAPATQPEAKQPAQRTKRTTPQRNRRSTKPAEHEQPAQAAQRPSVTPGAHDAAAPVHKQEQHQTNSAPSAAQPASPSQQASAQTKPEAAPVSAPAKASAQTQATEQPKAAPQPSHDNGTNNGANNHAERGRRGRRSQNQKPSTPHTDAKPERPTPQPASPSATASTSQAAVQTIDHTDIHPVRQETTIMIYMDESFGGGSDYQRNMSIGATVVDPDDTQALVPFMQTLYPFGWQPGDEVKARGKARDQLEAMLRHAKTPGAQTYAVYSPLSDTGNFSLSFGILYPYVAALLRILEALPTKPTKVRVVMDQRSEITDEQLAMAARMLHAYVKAQTGREVIFMFRTTDSKTTIGVQYSDFVSHAAMIFGPSQVASTGIHKLPNIGGQLGDQLQLFAMVGLQKYLLDDRPSQPAQSQAYKNPVLNAAARMAHLASKAASLTEVPDETFAQTKLVINQLLQIVPSSVSGAINHMPFQNWYDMVARSAAILHYTDETLPPFKIDPDAMQIINDALNNIATLLAGAR